MSKTYITQLAVCIQEKHDQIHYQFLHWLSSIPKGKIAVSKKVLVNTGFIMPKNVIRVNEQYNDRYIAIINEVVNGVSCYPTNYPQVYVSISNENSKIHGLEPQRQDQVNGIEMNVSQPKQFTVNTFRGTDEIPLFTSEIGTPMKNGTPGNDISSVTSMTRTKQNTCYGEYETNEITHHCQLEVQNNVPNMEMVVERLNQYNWLFPIEPFIRKLSNPESRHIWSRTIYWTEQSIDPNNGAYTRFMNTYDEYNLNENAILYCESSELSTLNSRIVTSLYERNGPRYYIEINSILRCCFTLQESLEILELFFGKNNIMVGYYCERVDSYLTITVRAHVVDIRSYVLQFTYQVATKDDFINGIFMKEQEKLMYFKLIEKSILSSLIEWFPFLSLS